MLKIFFKIMRFCSRSYFFFNAKSSTPSKITKEFVKRCQSFGRTFTTMASTESHSCKCQAAIAGRPDMAVFAPSWCLGSGELQVVGVGIPEF